MNRNVIAAAGIALWLLLMLFSTGKGGFVALWTNLVLLIALLLIGTFTRTVSVLRVLQFFSFGGFFMGVALVIGRVLPRTDFRAFVVPLMEEILKIAPLVWFLWRSRRDGIWSLGVTDVLLLATASGAGFGVVEDAYIRHLRHWPAHVPWLPVTEIIGGRVIPGHAIWTAVAGLTIGLAIMWRGRALMAIAPIGFLVSLADHAANNYGVRHRGALSTLLNGVTAQGYIVLILFVVGIVAAVAVDTLALSQLPRLIELQRPAGLTRLRHAWTFSLNTRSIAYALLRSRSASGRARAQAICAAALIDSALLNLAWQARTDLRQARLW